MVLAAGLGTRMKPLTDYFAKPFVPFLGKPAIYWTLDLLQGQVSEAVVNLHAHFESSQKSLKNYEWGALSYHVSDESKQLMGSAGAYREALSLLNGDAILSVNSDVIVNNVMNVMADLVAFHRTHDKKMSLLLTQNPALSGQKYREIIFNHLKQVTGYGELLVDVPFFTGFCVMDKTLFQDLPEHQCLDFLKQILDPAIKNHEVMAYLRNDLNWVDLGSSSSWMLAQFHYLELAYQNKLDPKVNQDLQERYVPVERQKNLWISRKTLKNLGDKIQFSSESKNCFIDLSDDVVLDEGIQIQSNVVLIQSQLCRSLNDAQNKRLDHVMMVEGIKIDFVK